MAFLSISKVWFENHLNGWMSNTNTVCMGFIKSFPVDVLPGKRSGY
ncbi:MAG: hypothetical protein WHT29_02580 [Bacteroidales bacterium]